MTPEERVAARNLADYHDMLDKLDASIAPAYGMLHEYWITNNINQIDQHDAMRLYYESNYAALAVVLRAVPPRLT